MRQTLKIFAGLSILAAVASCASPRGPGPQGRGEGPNGPREVRSSYVVMPTAMFLVSFDQDRDRRITHEELLSGAAFEWSLIATNKGKSQLGAIDFNNWVQDALGTDFTSFNRLSVDMNANSTVDENEFRAALEREFNLADRNKDGVVTRSELVSTLASQGRGATRGEGREQGQGGERGERGGRPPRN